MFDFFSDMISIGAASKTWNTLMTFGAPCLRSNWIMAPMSANAMS